MVITRHNSISAMLMLLPFLMVLQVGAAVKRIQPCVISLSNSSYHSLFDAADNKYTNVSEVHCVYRCAGKDVDIVMAFYDDKDRVCCCSFQSNIISHIERGHYRNVSVVDLTGPSDGVTRTGCRADQEGNNSVEKPKSFYLLTIMQKFFKYVPAY